jgi:hypothetical protein
MKKFFLLVLLCMIGSVAYANIPITFSVNMSIQMREGNFDPSKDFIYVRGNFQKDVGDTTDWGGAKFTTSDLDADSIYTITINFPDSLNGKSFEYKFVLNDGGWEALTDNRKLVVAGPSMDLPVVYFSDQSKIIVSVINTLNFTADISSIYGSGSGYFDPDKDSLLLEGLDWTGSTVVSGVRKMVSNPFSPWIYTTSMVIKGVEGDSTKWKLEAFPATDFFNTGWEVSNDKWTKIGADGTVTDVPSFVPDVYPQQPALTENVVILFQVNINNAVNRYTKENIDPKKVTFVGVKGQNATIGAWAGDWLLGDTAAGSLVLLNDSGKNGDKVAGDGIWSGNITFPVGNTGGPTLYKYGIFYTGEDTVNSGYHPMDNEFSDGSINHYTNVKVGQNITISDIFGDATHKSTTGVKKSDNLVPMKYSLEQNYPNPFNPSTVIKYSIPKAQVVTLKIFNVLGQEVATLINKQQIAGNYEVSFNASKLSSGVYIYQLNAGSFSYSKKMMLLK